MRFRDRTDAGRRLANALGNWQNRSDLVILALPRGGVPVAAQVAKALQAPLDIFVVRKLGVPGNEEFAFGAITSSGTRVIMPHTVRQLQISQKQIEAIAAREQREIARREQAYRGQRPPVSLGRKTVIVVDDGIATGATMLAAVKAIRQFNPIELIVAAPVAPTSVLSLLKGEVDQLVVLHMPDEFSNVGAWYQDFSQVSDDEVRHLLSSQPGEDWSGASAKSDADTLSNGRVSS